MYSNQSHQPQVQVRVEALPANPLQHALTDLSLLAVMMFFLLVALMG